jgi:glucokinase
MTQSTLGIDVGGTKIAAGVVTFPEGEVRCRRLIPTASKRGGEAVLGDVLRLSEDLIAEARGMSLRVGGIGAGVCELVDLSGKVVSESSIAWKGLEVQERLSKLAPAVVEADVRAAALAEACFGAGRPFRAFLYVTVGTGISSSLVLDKKPFAGARGLTGTMASSPLPRGDRLLDEKPWQGSMPTLEEIASGPALVARYNQRHPGATRSGEDVVARAMAGDAGAVAVLESAGEALGAAVGWLVNVLDPEAVIVGGGVGLSGGVYWLSFLSSARRHIWSELHRELPIFPAEKGADAGLIGAAAAAWRRQSGPSEPKA